MTNSHNNRSLVAWLYLGSAATSALGNAVATIVWPWLVLERTGDPAAAGMVAMTIAIPSILFAIIGGQLIDTFGRKPLSVISDIISALSILAVIAIDQTLGLNLPWFIIIGILGAVGDIPGMAARQSLVADVAETSGKTLDWLAGALQSVAGISFLLGPAIAGALIGLLPITSVLYITAGCSFLAAVFTMLLRLQPTTTTATQDPTQTNVFSDWKAWADILADAQVQLLAATSFVSSILVAPYLMVLLPAHFQSIDSPGYLGVAMSGYALGLIVCGLIIGQIGTDKRKKLWVLGLLAYIVGFFAIATLQIPTIVIAGMIIAGVGGGLHGPLSTVIITENIPEKLRGRAFSLFNATQLVAQPIGLGIATVLLSWCSIYTLAFGCAILWALTAIASGARGLKVIRDRTQPDNQPEITDANAPDALELKHQT